MEIFNLVVNRKENVHSRIRLVQFSVDLTLEFSFEQNHDFNSNSNIPFLIFGCHSSNILISFYFETI